MLFHPLSPSSADLRNKWNPDRWRHPWRKHALIGVGIICALALVSCGPAVSAAPALPAAQSAAVSSSTTPGVILTGGYETDPRDKGRPVVLIAAALGVPADVFRGAFSHVTPAKAGQEPDPIQVRKNKKALLDVLGPYGVTNEMLDRVSNYYRYDRSAGETWSHTPATVEPIVTNGVVTGVKIINPGSGYTSVPQVVITGADGATATATLSFGTDFASNGSLQEIVFVPNSDN